MAEQPPRLDPSRWLVRHRTVRFGDTDAAGVMHFPRLLHWCHEAYEESLERFGLAAAEVFPVPGRTPAVALPIVHCRADFLRPLVCGERVEIRLSPLRLDPGGFEVGYRFHRPAPGQGPGDAPGPEVARALTRHQAITTGGRRRCELPGGLQRWLEASGLGGGIRPL
jgi:1,4-dihydroxy-2-naphthoyl-CoA hydrolase